MHCTHSILACITLTCAYVGSLYIWRDKLQRDHPNSIKRRFFSVTCMMFIAPFVTNFFLDERYSDDVYYKLYGIRWSGLIPAAVISLGLTVVLFLGPLSLLYYSGTWKNYFQSTYWISSCKELIWLRNHVVAPLSEEWVFRSCMMPLLLQCLSHGAAVAVGPLLFGVAHFHHGIEQLREGARLINVILIATFQFMYTSLFGMYSAYLFLHTGHFVAPLLVHMFCNHMGFPSFKEISEFDSRTKNIIYLNFGIGLILWCLLVGPLTNPGLYDNKYPWTLDN